MFNLRWIIRFLRSVLIDFIEWIVVISSLAILTEVLTQPTELPGLLFTLVTVAGMAIRIRGAHRPAADGKRAQSTP